MAVTDVFAILTLKLKLPPHYVLYEMDAQEMEALLKNSHLVNQDEMEMMRLVAYVTAQVNSKNHLKVTDLVKFRWEESEKAVDVTAEEKRRLAEKAQMMKKYIQNGDDSNESTDNR